MTTTPVAPAPLEIGMVIYPKMTLLDLVGPQAVLGPHARTHLIWRTLDPVTTDTGVTLIPTCTFADCPTDLDVLFVPGGFGTMQMMLDAELLAFLADRGRTARYVTSVCTGALIIGAAGLLDGYKAATHWAAYDALAALGVECVRDRVVVDRNRITGGGVTAGLDFGLRLLAELRGDDTAKMTQLMLEYNPAPPFNAGHPTTAGPALTNMALAVMEASGEEGLSAMTSAAGRIHERRVTGPTSR